MTAERLVAGLIILWAVVFVWYLGKAIIKHKVKFQLKKDLNSLKPSVLIIWVSYFMVGAVSLSPAVQAWTERVQALNTSSTLAHSVVGLVPLVYLLTILYIVYRVLRSMQTEWVKYTEDERKWIEEDRAKFMAKVPKWLKPIFRKDKKHETIVSQSQTKT